MEKQYYTPKIEHFHVGFRYEHFEDWDVPNKEKEWHKQVYGKNGTNWEQMDYVDDSTIANGRIRVKSLDNDDIIEAGWEESTTSFSESRQYYSLGEYECFLEDGEIFISYEWAEDENRIFKGKVPNYNKLLDVMEMLEIRNNK